MPCAAVIGRADNASRVSVDRTRCTRAVQLEAAAKRAGNVPYATNSQTHRYPPNATRVFCLFTPPPDTWGGWACEKLRLLVSVRCWGFLQIFARRPGTRSESGKSSPALRAEVRGLRPRVLVRGRLRKHSNRPAFHASSVAQQTHQGSQLAESTCSRGLRRTLFRSLVASGVGACGIAHSKRTTRPSVGRPRSRGLRYPDQVPVPVDDAVLRQIADLSGGGSFTASSLADLCKAYGTLSDQIGYDTVRGNANGLDDLGCRGDRRRVRVIGGFTSASTVSRSPAWRSRWVAVLWQCARP